MIFLAKHYNPFVRAADGERISSTECTTSTSFLRGVVKITPETDGAQVVSTSALLS